MHTIKFLIILCVVFVVAFFITLFSGIISIAVKSSDPPLMDLVLISGMKHSVRFHARGIKPPDLKARQMITSGEELYQGLCAICHGGQDALPSALGQGLNPPAPPLNNEPAKWTAAQVFWIMKNGIKMTGMPSFGISHDSSDLWDITAYVMNVPSGTAHKSLDRSTSDDSSDRAMVLADKGIGPIKTITLGTIDQKLSTTGSKIFNRSCTSCHLLDAPITGPALRSEALSHSPEFIMNMLVNTVEMVGKDPFVNKTMARFGNLKMPATKLDGAKARAVLEFLRTAAAMSPVQSSPRRLAP